jgi:hypothetical protein
MDNRKAMRRKIEVRPNHGPALGKFNKRWSFEEAFGNDTDSDSLDSDMTVPMEKA